MTFFCFLLFQAIFKWFVSFLMELFFLFQENTLQYLKRENSTSSNIFQQKRCCENFQDLQLKKRTIKLCLSPYWVFINELPKISVWRFFAIVLIANL